MKILLVDNFNECPLDDKSKNIIIDRFMKRFDKVIITTRENENVVFSYFLFERCR